jgi:hypothetical protein
MVRQTAKRGQQGGAIRRPHKPCRINGTVLNFVPDAAK